VRGRRAAPILLLTAALAWPLAAGAQPPPDHQPPPGGEPTAQPHPGPQPDTPEPEATPDPEPAEPGTGPAADPDADAGTGEPRDSGVADAGVTDAGTASAEPAVDLLPDELRPRLSLAVDPAEGTMTGDLVTLSITADAEAGDDLGIPDQPFDPFEVFDTELDEGEPEGGRKQLVFRLELLALEPGEHEVGPVRVRLVEEDGTIGFAETGTVVVEVGSVLGNEPNAEPKPATEPVRVMEEDYTLAWIGGGLLAVLLVALLAFLAARWWMRRERKAPPPPPPRPPWETALEKLERLRAVMKDRIAAGDVMSWADELSDVVREYLGHRYDFEGLESTTDEVLSRLRRIRPVGIGVEEVAALLGDTDLVKFAKATPGEEQCDELLAAAYRIVRATTPSARPTGTGDGRGSGPQSEPGSPRGQGQGQRQGSERREGV